MAEAGKTKDAEGEAEEQAKPKKNKRKLIIFTAIGIVALALVGGAAFFLFDGSKKSADDEAGDAVPEEVLEKRHDQPPVYLKLDTFTTNLAIEDGASSGTAGQYIQVVVELKVEDAPSGETLKQYMPEIRNNILRLLSAKRPSQLASTDGKDLLASEIRNSVNGITNPIANKAGKVPRGPVDSVLFSSFIIQ